MAEQREARDHAETDDERRVMAVFREDPETARLMNVGALTEAILFGYDHQGVSEEDLPEQEVYDRFRAACESLTSKGVLTKTDYFGEVVYAVKRDPATQEATPNG